ncbi:MAG: hypothetical protein ACUVXI_17230 [bacterium]
MTSSIAESSSKSVGLARVGEGAVMDVVTRMQVIRDTVDGSAKAVRELGERSREIGNIVDLIKWGCGL